MKVQQIEGGIAMVVGVLLVLSPLVYWARNPELTQMQVFLECWGQLFGGMVLTVIGAHVAGLNNKGERGSDDKGDSQ